MDWAGSQLVECIPGKVSGRPVARGTRILAKTIVEDYALGSSIDEILENYPALSPTTIEDLLAYAAIEVDSTFHW